MNLSKYYNFLPDYVYKNFSHLIRSAAGYARLFFSHKFPSRLCVHICHNCVLL